MDKFFAVIVVALALVVGACTGTITGDVNLDRLGIKLGVMEYIGDDIEKADKILALVDAVDSELDEGAFVVAEALEDYLRSQIDITDKPAEQIVLIDELLMLISSRIAEKIDVGEVSPDVTVQIRQVSAWVREAALIKKTSLETE